ncbi:DUF3572 domain-containing protein [Paramagnetospirillum kuznetsovii]|uniref:DUF3572 domain-containing protein n=1 Tax=Paramagnetospirillum kuznetsovii TaxID=2053833 RepID=A0A364NZ40_9PROT|nr:DUF3572 domain-containing protein [Paramagnetospirillum kuznetsovii]RAU22344.1 DUF3572 domain-containing protein [Paramagnetospirillum kuznetsovii]
MMARIPQTEQAEIIALRGLAWLLSDSERAERFLTTTGCDASTLRQRAGDPALLGFVLDALLGDEAALVDFAAWAEVGATEVSRARALLPGAMPDFHAP